MICNVLKPIQNLALYLVRLNTFLVFIHINFEQQTPVA